MSEQLLIESLERYFNDEMLPEEKAYFEQMRQDNPELDQMVVTHKIFMGKMAEFAERQKLMTQLSSTHDHLLEKGAIAEDQKKISKGKIRQLWHRYKKTTAIAACIAGLTALIISGVISTFGPASRQTIELLSRDIEQLKKTQDYQYTQIKEATKLPEGAVVKSGGSAFMIDGKGYLLTNAHVLKGSSAVVANADGQEFKTSIVYVDHAKDLAVLKITDSDYEPVKTLPYDLKSTSVNLGAEVFTLGYPRNDITYNKGYLSAVSGFDGDTSTVQISLLANPGNSGGPVFNRYGDIIGILSTREANAQGVTFAIKSKEIVQSLESWNDKDTSAVNAAVLNGSRNLKGMNRENQLKSLQQYVYNVKAYN
ncbi:S1C family serine protease [Arachidicoccus terrestris]|uniref:S1C family serine protease n=1 Tax=Arachidicoccus terrestris TaxID=2875539 RepID=UPI001CC462D0|nr:serine protease [Arachidicoccus terrestris]UAY54656.1 serine protease [Arachidicoccus terrestris]